MLNCIDSPSCLLSKSRIKAHSQCRPARLCAQQFVRVPVTGRDLSCIEGLRSGCCKHVFPPKTKLHVWYYVKHFQISAKCFPKWIVLFSPSWDRVS